MITSSPWYRTVEKGRCSRGKSLGKVDEKGSLGGNICPGGRPAKNHDRARKEDGWGARKSRKTGLNGTALGKFWGHYFMKRHTYWGKSLGKKNKKKGVYYRMVLGASILV